MENMIIIMDSFPPKKIFNAKKNQNFAYNFNVFTDSLKPSSEPLL